LLALQALQPTKRKDQRPWPIIDKVSGVLKPGRLTLLLGTPGAGRSLLMKALAGRLTLEKTLKVGEAGRSIVPASYNSGSRCSRARLTGSCLPACCASASRGPLPRFAYWFVRFRSQRMS
jgi:energy-coupling factor transporter ATP-binding protein EcfA2